MFRALREESEQIEKETVNTLTHHAPENMGDANAREQLFGELRGHRWIWSEVDQRVKELQEQLTKKDNNENERRNARHDGDGDGLTTLRRDEYNVPVDRDDTAGDTADTSS